MKNDLKYGVAATAAVIHGRGRCRSVLVGDVDVHFDVFLRHHVAHGQVLHVRTRASVFAHAQRRGALTGDVRTKEIVDFFVVNLVAGDFDVELVLNWRNWIKVDLHEQLPSRYRP